MFLLWILTTTLAFASASRSSAGPKQKRYGQDIQAPKRRRGLVNRAPETVISPKVFVISMFDSEATPWYTNMPGLLEHNITVPGFSPLFPDAHCLPSGEVCQLTTGEGEINAASTISALWLSPSFNLTKTYFLIAGIAGINPHYGTTGSVVLARYAVQFDLQYVFDRSEVPANFTSGYVPQGASIPDSTNPAAYPTELYGTEAFEVSLGLRDRFFDLASTVALNDTADAAAYRAKYTYAPGNQPPSVVKCDSGTSNDYWTGEVIGDAFSAYTKLLTNGSGVYCVTQQEDNATLEALLRGHIAGAVDFARVAIMRTASDFDRAPAGVSETYHLLEAEQGGFEPSIENIWIAGSKIVDDVLGSWEILYGEGMRAGNYLGDLFDSLDWMGPGEGIDIGTEAFYLY